MCDRLQCFELFGADVFYPIDQLVPLMFTLAKSSVSTLYGDAVALTSSVAFEQMIDAALPAIESQVLPAPHQLRTAKGSKPCIRATPPSQRKASIGSS